MVGPEPAPRWDHAASWRRLPGRCRRAPCRAWRGCRSTSSSISWPVTAMISCACSRAQRAALRSPSAAREPSNAAGRPDRTLPGSGGRSPRPRTACRMPRRGRSGAKSAGRQGPRQGRGRPARRPPPACDARSWPGCGASAHREGAAGPAASRPRAGKRWRGVRTARRGFVLALPDWHSRFPRSEQAAP